MNVIKKMIADYDGLIKFYEDRMQSHKKKLQEAEDVCSALETAMLQVAGIEDAEEALAQKLYDKHQWISKHGERFFAEAKAEYEHVKSSRKHFIQVMQQNCEHDMKFDYADHHKNEDFYKCDICGLSQ